MVACSLQCPAAHRHRAIYRILLSPVQRPKKTKKPAQTHCLSGTNTDKQYPWYHPHSGRPALSFADRHCSDLHSTRNTALRLIHGVLVTGTHPVGCYWRRIASAFVRPLKSIHLCFLRRASTIPQLSVGFCRGLLLFIFGLNGKILSHLPRPVKGDS